MVASAALAQPNMLRGLLAAALSAWVLTLAIDFFGMTIGIFAAPIFSQEIEFWRFNSFPTMAMLYAAVGIPLALVVTYAIGWPVWSVLNARGLIGFRNAIFVGALIGGAVALCEIASTYFYGQQLASDPSWSSETTTYGYAVQRNGMPTALGWALLGVRDIGTVLTGAVAGAIAWRIGKPRSV